MANTTYIKLDIDHRVQPAGILRLLRPLLGFRPARHVQLDSRKFRILLYSCLLPLLMCAFSVQAKEVVVDEKLRLLLKHAIESSDSFSDRFEAEVWLVDMSNRLADKMPEPDTRLRLLKQIHYEASRAGLYPELVLAVIDVESNFDQFAISRAGAIGLMQVMPFWLEEIGRPQDNLFDINTNLRIGCTILRYYLDMENGDLTQALARYNGSKGSYRYTNKIFSVLNRRWRKY